MYDILKRLRQWFGLDYPPIALYPEDMRETERYYHRTHHTDLDVDSDCTSAHSMFLLRSYSGKREYFTADTSKGELIPCVLILYYQGERQYLENVEIRPSIKSRGRAAGI